MTTTLETRAFDLEEIELRQTPDSKPKIIGYAAVFNVLSENLGGFREKIRPGAFTRSLNEGTDVVANVDHSDDALKMLGRRSAQTLVLSPNQKGLAVEIDPPDTQAGRDVIALLDRKELRKMSFAFYTVQEEWHDIDGLMVRELVDVDLVDVAIVSRPAYPQTEVSLRHFQDYLASIEQRQANEVIAKIRSVPSGLKSMRHRLWLAENFTIHA